MRQIATYAGLIPMAFFGVLIRLGFEALGDYEGRTVYPVLWAQGVGCAIMGTSLSLKSEIHEFYPPLYTALTTGLAGSTTSFSSWMLDGFESFANLGHYDRGGLRDAMDGLAYSFSTLAVSIACLLFGQFSGSLIQHWLDTYREKSHRRANNSIGLEKKQMRIKTNDYQHTIVFDSVSIALACAFYAGALAAYFAGPRQWRPDVTFALLLGPPGAILRFMLAKINTKGRFLTRFPMGTFVANMLASGVVSASYVVQRTAYNTGLTTTGCDAMIALEQGFCGCLSTVSTFAVEIRSIDRARWKATYVLTSVVLGHALVLAIVGGVKWSPEGLGPFCR
ncbi:hypothetical protein NliqN6_2108 [Naganishia liquefaciens]|uniref:Uncharacterized protein n=1 Tax=Naganishia liquefaciens TaxID=104408 RepID=A0A8H3YFH9_9TREE|nr:hypothetical protein NliqN6_2108 [Naganishia liquefaciens]